MMQKVRVTLVLLRYPALVIIGLVIIYGILQPGNFTDTKIEGRTLWDWLDLLIIPVVLAGAALWFNWRGRQIAEEARKTDREIARAKRHEDILQNYLDKMTDLMRDEEWLNPLNSSTDDATTEDNADTNEEHKPLHPKAERLFDIARVRTVSTLRALEWDHKRQTSVVHFLREAELFDGEKQPALLAEAIMQSLRLGGLDLREANLEGANLFVADLQEANLEGGNLQGAYLGNANLKQTRLEGANLQGAVLRGAYLQKAFMSHTNLQGANLFLANLQEALLFSADLQGAVLREANLQGVRLVGAILSSAKLLGANLYNARLEGADLMDIELDDKTTLPDGTKWSEDVDMRKFTDAAHPEFWEPK